MAVTAGVSRDGMIGLVDAEALVLAGNAAWLWRDDCQLENLRPPDYGKPRIRMITAKGRALPPALS